MRRTISLFLVGGIAACVAACSGSKKPSAEKCPASPVVLGTWIRTPTTYGDASLLIPPGSETKLIPADEGTVGEAWGERRWGIYYKLDSVRTEHSVEIGPKVTDVVNCVDTVSGRPVKITLLHSTASNITGEFGQASWDLPGNKTFFLAVLTPERAARDSVLSVLRSVQFKDTSTSKP